MAKVGFLTFDDSFFAPFFTCVFEEGKSKRPDRRKKEAASIKNRKVRKNSLGDFFSYPPTDPLRKNALLRLHFLRNIPLSPILYNILWKKYKNLVCSSPLERDRRDIDLFRYFHQSSNFFSLSFSFPRAEKNGDFNNSA